MNLKTNPFSIKMSLMKGFKPTTITMCCELTSSVDIESLSKIIPVKILYDATGEKIEVNTLSKVDNKIKFYGTNGIIISCCYEDTFKGVRKGGKQLHKVVGLDLQINNKNINIKISSKKLQLTGAASKDGGANAFEKMCAVINQLQTKINSFKKYKKENLNIIKNIILFNYSFSKTKDFDTHFDKLILPILENENHHLSREEKEGIIDKYNTKYLDHIEYFKTYSLSPEEDEHSLSEILRIFLGGTKIVESEKRSLSLKGIRVINLLAMNKIEAEDKIPILHVIDAFSEKFPMMNRGVEEANRFHLKVPFTSGGKTFFHKFNFFATGTIRQHSPIDEKEARQIHSEIVEIIGKVLKKWDINVKS